MSSPTSCRATLVGPLVSSRPQQPPVPATRATILPQWRPCHADLSRSAIQRSPLGSLVLASTAPLAGSHCQLLRRPCAAAADAEAISSLATVDGAVLSESREEDLPPSAREILEVQSVQLPAHPQPAILPAPPGSMEGGARSTPGVGDGGRRSVRAKVLAAVRGARRGEQGPRLAVWSRFLAYEGRPALVYEDTVPYFAYGSNLNLDLLRARTGGADVLAAEPGRVTDHRLAFNVGSAFSLLEPAMAAIEPEAGSTIHGLLALLTRPQYELLYLSEGGAGGPARSYLEYEVTVATYSGRSLQAVALRTNPASPTALPRDKERVPSTRYKNLILRGARTIGLQPSYISYLESIPGPFGIVWRPAVRTDQPPEQ